MFSIPTQRPDRFLSSTPQHNSCTQNTEQKQRSEQSGSQGRKWTQSFTLKTCWEGKHEPFILLSLGELMPAAQQQKIFTHLKDDNTHRTGSCLPGRLLSGQTWSEKSAAVKPKTEALNPGRFTDICFQLTCFFLYSISCDRPNAVATAPPPRMAVRFRAFLNAMVDPAWEGEDEQ